MSVGLTVYNQEVFVTKTASELLFEGYQDDMIDIARSMPTFMGDTKVEVPFDRFGWFYMVSMVDGHKPAPSFVIVLFAINMKNELHTKLPHDIFFQRSQFSNPSTRFPHTQRNGTTNQTGHYNINTGADDISRIGRVEAWNYQQRTNFFPAECGMINGSAGELYPPQRTKERPVSFWSGDMCRTLDFDFDSETKVHGVDGYKFAGGRKTVDNGTEFPESGCFNEGERVPSGVMNVTSCRYGTPVFMSFPHYYAADPYYLQHVDGLQPDREKHEFFMTMEPMTGVPLDVAARLQINMLIRPTPYISLYENAPEMFFPVLWFEQRVTMGVDMVDEIRLATEIPRLGYVCCAAVVLLGAVLMMWLPLTRLLARLCGCATEADSDAVGSSKKFGTNLDMHKPEGSPLMERSRQGHGVVLMKRTDKCEMTNGKSNGSTVAESV